MENQRVSVLVVGAGYAGLSAALLLAWRDVPVMLVERHPGTSYQPKAFGVNPRAVEMLRIVPGTEQALCEISAGIGENLRIAVATSLNDPDPHMIMADEQEAFAFLADATPARQVGAPQAAVERVLRAKAEELGADLRFSTEMVSLRQDDEGVTAIIRSGGEDSEVRADYVVSADGHHGPVRRSLGIPVTGKGVLGSTCSIMFDADLSGLAPEREVTLWYLRNDVFTGVILTGTGVGAHILGVNYDPSTGESADDFTPERSIELIRIATGIADLEVRLLDRAEFTMSHVLAERYREGRVFLAGDSAHTMPPTGGQAGSTALQDGCDLAWRLWLVLTGQAGEDFLDTYDAERRPVGVLTADAQLANLGVRMPPASRVGYPEPPADPMRAILGCRYHSTAIIEEPDDDGSLLEDPRQPTGRPGSRAPHVRLGQDGRELSVIDLFGAGFVLLAARRAGRAWAEAGRAVAERLGVLLSPILVDEDLMDVKDGWSERYGVHRDGAVLVRPDGYVAWRSQGPDATPDATLERVLRRILSR